MAERVIAVKFSLDTGDSIQELDSIAEALAVIEDEIRNVDKAAAAGTAEEAFRELNKIVEENSLSIQELGTAADNYKNIALAAGKESPIGKAALKRAADMEKQMNQVNTEVTQLAEGGRTLNTTLQLGTGVVAGFTAFQGVTAALGVENEDLQESIVKVQAAQAALMGVKELALVLDRKGLVVTKAVALGNVILAAGQKVYTLAVGTSTGALKLFRLALISTGIGAIIVALGFLIANFDLVTEKVRESVNWLRELGVVGKVVFAILLPPLFLLIEVYDRFFAASEKQRREETKREKLFNKNAAAEKKRHEERLKRIDEERDARIEAADDIISALELEKDTLDAEGKASDELAIKILEAELEKVQAVLEANSQKIASQIEYYQNIARLQGQSDEEFKQSMAAQGIDLNALQDEANKLIEQNQRTVQFAQNKITKFKREQLEKQSEDRTHAFNEWEVEELDFLDDSLKSWADYTKDVKEIIEVEDISFDDFLDEEELDIEMEKTVSKFQEFTGRIAGFFKTGSENIKNDLTETLQQVQAGVDMAMESLTAVNELLNQLGENRIADNEDRRDEDLNNLQKNKKAELKQENLSARQKAIIEQKFAIQEFKIKKAAAAANDKIAKAAFNRDKGLRIAQAGIDTAGAIVKAIGIYGPPPSPLGIAGIISASIIGAAQIATIAATRFEGTAGSISPPDITIPSADTGGDAGGTGAGDGGDGGQNDVGTDTDALLNPQPLQVSIVEIESVNNQVQEIDNISTIGG